MANFAWSYSRIKNFETCPRQYHEVNVLKKHPFRETPETRYGNEFHKSAEDYVKSDTPLPGKFAHYEKLLQALKDKPGEKHCELKFGMTEDLKPCGYFDRQVWFRGIADLLIIDGDTATVVDYKTGKSARYADPDQLELMALCVFAHFPKVKRVRAGLVFVVANALRKETYTVDTQEAKWGQWFQRVGAMQAAHKSGVFNPRPSGLCRAHCPVVECPHNGSNT